MEIQLYNALIEAGVKAATATTVVDSLEREIRERMADAKKEVATKSDIAELKASIAETKASIAEAKTEIIKWNLGTLMAVVGIMLAMSKLTGHG